MKHHVDLMAEPQDDKGEVKLLATWKGEKGQMDKVGTAVEQEQQ